MRTIARATWRRGGCVHASFEPRRGGSSIETESRWLPQLAPALPVSVPQVLAVGHPGYGYAERWAVTRRIEGFRQRHRIGQVQQLMPSLAILRHSSRPCTASTCRPTRPPIRRFGHTAPGPCRTSTLRSATISMSAELWTTFRLTRRVLRGVGGSRRPPYVRRGGRLLGALGLSRREFARTRKRVHVGPRLRRLAVGDPSMDPVVAWEVFARGARGVFRSRLDVDDLTWQRGRGWALAIPVMTCPTTAFHAGPLPTRLASAHQVLADHRRRRASPSGSETRTRMHLRRTR